MSYRRNHRSPTSGEKIGLRHPYDAVVDKNGEVWAGGMANDRVVRVDSRTGKSTEYLLPHETNIRRVFVDNSTTPVTFWAGDDHHHSIFKVQPLD